jgi:AbrB family looped-hinge helix DNA binding protein
MIFRGKISDRGRIVVPSQLRKSLGLEPGNDVVIREYSGALHIVSLKQAVHQIQNLVNSRISDDISLVDELLSMRREEIEQERRSESDTT